MLNGLLALLMVLMAFIVKAALAFFLARHSWQWSGEYISPRKSFMMNYSPRLSEIFGGRSLMCTRGQNTESWY